MATFHGAGTVWDAARGKALCRFNDGDFSTNDERVIEILTKLGYQRVDEAVAESEEIRPRRGRPRNA